MLVNSIERSVFTRREFHGNRTGRSEEAQGLPDVTLHQENCVWTPPKYDKSRADHYLPQGYLRGFAVSGKGPLSVLNVATGRWRSQSSAQLGWESGFYDYAGVLGERTHPDDEFKELENGYPRILAALSADGYRAWRAHEDFFLRYMQMIRCRSPLFREQFMQEWGQKKGARVVGVTSKEGKHEVAVDSLKLRHFSPRALKDAAIQRMLDEMKKGPSLLKTFFWQLRITPSDDDPFITHEQPLLAGTPHPDLEYGLKRIDAVMWFPLNWQACLVGFRDPFALDMFGGSSIERSWIRHQYLATAKRFVVSPKVL